MSPDHVRRATTPVRVTALDGDRAVDRPDRLVTEEPMEIRVHGPGQDPRPLVVTMRTPGNDFELAVGFCLTEGVITGPDDVETVAYCLAGEGEQEFNVVTVALRRPVVLDGPERRFVANASCGLCGKTTLDEVEHHCGPVADGPGRRTDSVIASLPDTPPRRAAGVRRDRRAARGRRRSAPTASWSRCARTSAVTTRSTSWSVTRCSSGGCRSRTRC